MKTNSVRAGTLVKCLEAIAISGMLAAFLLNGVKIGVISGGWAKTDATAGQQEAQILIVPGESVGKVRRGMSTNEVEAILGQPEQWQGKIMVYDQKLGMSVGQSKRGVLVVFCGDSLFSHPGAKKFTGRTKGGVGIESSRDDVIREFGQPTTAHPWGNGQEQLGYPQMGLTFALKSGKVMNITADFRFAR